MFRTAKRYKYYVKREHKRETGKPWPLLHTSMHTTTTTTPRRKKKHEKNEKEPNDFRSKVREAYSEPTNGSQMRQKFSVRRGNVNILVYFSMDDIHIHEINTWKRKKVNAD